MNILTAHPDSRSLFSATRLTKMLSRAAKAYSSFAAEASPRVGGRAAKSSVNHSKHVDHVDCSSRFPVAFLCDATDEDAKSSC